MLLYKTYFVFQTKYPRISTGVNEDLKKSGLVKSRTQVVGLPLFVTSEVLTAGANIYPFSCASQARFSNREVQVFAPTLDL